MFRTGPRNLITDVAGLRVGNAADARLKSGVTVVVCDEPAVAGVQVLGGAPGTRETDLLEPQNSIAMIHAVALSGGSAFGLDAASGVQAAMREKNIGVEAEGGAAGQDNGMDRRDRILRFEQIGLARARRAAQHLHAGRGRLIA